ncbi:hypothetical protein Ferp_0869 [Ferroglobus placidus DSM 10642]|uniref:Uncharacterized protein n=1 Tax=Ferroglobus placidus (strain DSM 10642 / AEDII12DO) TaxID=589924 RepID=D3RX24_FERPA|nr:hypothetical protein Ferp_0869 [Ferroglobus placidus DSM 10642]
MELSHVLGRGVVKLRAVRFLFAVLLLEMVSGTKVKTKVKMRE